MPEIVVTSTGPLFDGRAPAVMRRLMEEVTWEVGAQALADVHRLLDQSIRHPTPYYETQVTMQRVTPDVVVHDRGVIYGNWLEGTSSRNTTTRFKGYHSFRRAAQGLQQKVPALTAAAVARGVARLGG